MDIRQLLGYDTFTSFINIGTSVGDFNRLKFDDKSELYIHLRIVDSMIGMLLLPAQAGSRN